MPPFASSLIMHVLTNAEKLIPRRDAASLAESRKLAGIRIVTGTTSPFTRYERISVSPASCSIRSEYVIAFYTFKLQYKCNNSTPAWEQRKLGELVTTTIGGGTPSTSNPAYWDGEIPWIQSSNVLEDTLFDVDIPKAITQKGLEESAAQIVPENSIAVVTHVGVGKLIYLPFQYSTSQDFISLCGLKGDARYTCYALWKRLQEDLHIVQGSAIKGITKEDLLEKNLPMPSVEEQAQIGVLFSQLDNLITLHQRKRLWFAK
ncbi:restriction endonuclease S subunit [Bifidobacterium longum]|nr:restriction endonuclease S subunit [Bifidobacterium longum]